MKHKHPPKDIFFNYDDPFIFIIKLIALYNMSLLTKQFLSYIFKTWFIGSITLSFYMFLMLEVRFSAQIIERR